MGPIPSVIQNKNYIIKYVLGILMKFMCFYDYLSFFSK